MKKVFFISLLFLAASPVFAATGYPVTDGSSSLSTCLSGGIGNFNYFWDETDGYSSAIEFGTKGHCSDLTATGLIDGHTYAVGIDGPNKTGHSISDVLDPYGNVYIWGTLHGGLFYEHVPTPVATSTALFSASDVIGQVGGGVGDTGKPLWPIVAVSGVPIAFFIGRYAVKFIQEAV